MKTYESLWGYEGLTRFPDDASSPPAYKGRSVLYRVVSTEGSGGACDYDERMTLCELADTCEELELCDHPAAPSRRVYVTDRFMDDAANLGCAIPGESIESYDLISGRALLRA